MSINCPYRLVRDALGFYNQVPVTPDGDAEEIETKSEIPPKVAPAERATGRPKRAINADFEVET